MESGIKFVNYSHLKAKGALSIRKHWDVAAVYGFK
jgi:hypothetical protein